MRQVLSFTLDKPSDMKDIGADSIKEIILKNDNVLEQRPPEILMNAVNSKTIELKIFFWTRDFNKSAHTVADLRAAIYQHLEKKGLTVI